ncbi:MAG TPA: SRPBCC family protein [Actinomycetota bacterium]|nr:SRPBCC family protein [Actinomycetota bacterium]
MAETVSDSIDVAAPAAEVFAVATDFEAYPQWNESVEKVEVRAADDDGRATIVWFEVDARVRVVRYTLAYDYSNAPRAFSWDLVDGDVAALRGSYEFDELDGVTEVRYELSVDPGFPLPAFLRRQASRQIARAALADLKRRVESA